MASALANLIGVPRTPRGTYSAEEISQAELHWGIRRVLELRAGKKPLVLVFEDLHWAEPTLFDLLDFLRAGNGPILLIGSARRELEQLRPALCTDGESKIAIVLTALGEAESEALLAELLGAHSLPAGGHAEVLAPTKLRAMVRREHAAALRRYRKPARAGRKERERGRGRKTK